MQDEASPKEAWYLRREGRQAGPFSAAAVRRLVLQEQVRMEDEVSLDRQSWSRVGDVAEVVPPQMRGAAFSDLLPQRRHAVPWMAISLFVVIVAGIAGFGIWWGGGSLGQGADCEAAPQPGVNWQNCRLRGLQAAGADLKAALLRNADLFDAAFTGANLSGARLDYANLSRADLAYATLRGASLRGTDLSYADLTNADLAGTDLSFADLTGAVLAGASLQKARFDHALWLDGRTCRKGSVGGCRPLPQGKDSVR